MSCARPCLRRRILAIPLGAANEARKDSEVEFSETRLDSIRSSVARSTLQALEVKYKRNRPFLNVPLYCTVNTDV